MQHLDEGTIHAWLDGALPIDDQMLVEQHVHDCAKCAALVADARGMIAGATRIVSALDGVPGGVIPPKQSASPVVARRSVWGSLWLTPFRAALAATLMLAVASMLAVRHNTPNKLVISGPDQRPVAAASSVPAAPPPSAPVVRAASAGSSAKPPLESTAEAQAARPERKAAPAPTVDVSAASLGAAAPTTTMNAARDQGVRSEAERAKAAPVPQMPPAAAAVNEAKVSAADFRSRSDSAGRVVRIALDSVTGRPVAGGVARRAFAQTSAPQPVQLNAVVATSSNDTAPLLVGCYRIIRDALVPLSLVPDRFGLDQTGSPIRNVVRSINVSGGMDSVLTTATWSSTTRGTAVVMWTDGLDREVLLVTMGSTGVTAQAMVRGRSQSIGVTRVTCSR